MGLRLHHQLLTLHEPTAILSLHASTTPVRRAVLAGSRRRDGCQGGGGPVVRAGPASGLDGNHRAVDARQDAEDYADLELECLLRAGGIGTGACSAGVDGNRGAG